MKHIQPTTVTVKNLDNSEVEITITLPAEALTQAREEALAEYKQSVQLDGFRPGKAPNDLVAQKVGEGALLEKAATIAIDTAYPHVVVEKKLDVIGRPEVRVTKLALGNELEFTVKTAIYPDVTLPDYKKIAQKVFAKAIPEQKASDDEVQKALLHMRREKARIDAFEQAQKDGKEGDDLQKVFTDLQNLKDEDLPELTDEFVGQLGDFKTLAEFEANVSENIAKEKVLREEEKRRAQLLETVAKETKVTVPEVLVRGEQQRIEAEFTGMLGQQGLTLDGYLEHAKKSKEDIEKEWATQAKERATLQLAITEIAKQEKLSADEAAVEAEVARVLQQYKEAKEENVRAFVEQQEQNKAVLKFLEEAGAKK